MYGFNQACTFGFLKLHLSVMLIVGMCVYIPTPEVNNDYSHEMKLYKPNKQMLQLSNLFIWQLLTILWIGMALVTKCIMNTH